MRGDSEPTFVASPRKKTDKEKIRLLEYQVLILKSDLQKLKDENTFRRLLKDLMLLLWNFKKH